MPGLPDYSLFEDYEDPQNKIKNILDNFFSSQRPLFSLSDKIWNPPTDLYETADAIIIKMEIAGVKSSNIEISIQDNHLIIKGSRLDDPDVTKENYHLMEIHFGNFKRLFTLPSKLSLNDIRAYYKDGFLKVIIPKVEGKRKPDISISVE